MAQSEKISNRYSKLSTVGFGDWLSHLKVGQKIAWGYGLTLGIAVLGTATGFTVADYYQQQANKLEADAVEEMDLLNSLERSVLQVYAHQHQLIPLMEKPDLWQKEYSHFLKHAAEARQVWSEFKSSEGSIDPEFDESSEEIESVTRFLQTYDGFPVYLRQTEELLQQIEARNLKAEEIKAAQTRLLNFTNDASVFQFDGLLEDLDKLIQIASQEYDQAKAALIAAAKLRSQVITTSLLLSIAIATLFAIRTSRAIAHPIQVVTKVAQQVTQASNFDLQAPVTTQDEVGVLATSLNQLIQQVKQLLQEQIKANEKLEDKVEERTAQLHQKTSELEAILNGFPDLFFRLASDGTILDYKSGHKDLYVPPEEFLGKRMQEVLPPSLAEQFKQAIAQVQQTQSLVSIEYSLPILSGEEHYEGRLIPLGTEHLIFIVRNVSDRQQAENELKESQQLLELVINNIPQLIFWKDRNSVYLGCNRNFACIAGVGEPQNIVGKTDYDLPWTKEESDWYRECDVRVTASNQPQLHIIETQLQADGKQIWADTSKIPLHDAEGNVIGILGTYEDITERKAAEEALRQNEQQLKQKAQDLEQILKELQRTQSQLIQSEKMSSLGQMVAGVAHEINNPVNFIHGNLTHVNQYAQDLLELVQLYQKHYLYPPAEIAAKIEDIDIEFLTEDLTKVLKSMRVGTDRIREIVLSLRNFSRLDEAEFKQVDIHEGIESTLMILNNRLKAKPKHPEIQVIKEYGKLPLVECYPGQLNQVFMNLLANAIDALEEAIGNRSLVMGNREESSNYQSPSIRIRTEVLKNNWIAIRIADNGPGMSEEVRERLFDPFFTTKPVGKGTGLGLSISYQIVVEKHSGKFHCHSVPAQGTEFAIEIPIRQ
jgi:two-component system, NtrC family, sensor kinase